MKIGVVYEGPTDYFAIRSFLAAALASINVAATFVDLQPQLDATQVEGGWTHIHLWLDRNPPAQRVLRYLKGGLFEDDLDSKSCDLILIQMDCDHLSHRDFINYASRHGLDVAMLLSTLTKYEVAHKVLEVWSGIGELSEPDVAKHIIAPAQESTESWCIAAFGTADVPIDDLCGEILTTKFMQCLEASEGRRALNNYSNVDKSVKRRRRFCDRHANGFQNAIDGSESFRLAWEKLRAQCKES